MNPLFLIREFDPETDYPTICDWHDAHGTTPPPLAILPRLGVIVFEEGGDMAGALWLYMDNSVGVCFPEHAVTRPRLSGAKVKRVGLVALEFLRMRAAELDYGVMIMNTLPIMGRIVAKYAGFEKVGDGKVTMIGLTKEVSNGN